MNLSSTAPLHLAFEGPSPVPHRQKGVPLTFLCSDLSLDPGSHPQAACLVCGQWYLEVGDDFGPQRERQTLALLLAVRPCASEVQLPHGGEM